MKRTQVSTKSTQIEPTGEKLDHERQSHRIPTARDIMTKSAGHRRSRNLSIFERHRHAPARRTGFPVPRSWMCTAKAGGDALGEPTASGCWRPRTTSIASHLHEDGHRCKDYHDPGGASSFGSGRSISTPSLTTSSRKPGAKRFPWCVDRGRLVGQVSRRDVLKAVEEIGQKRQPNRKQVPATTGCPRARSATAADSGDAEAL